MYISEIVEIFNYRNLTGKTIKFNEKLNFLSVRIILAKLIY